MTGLPCLIVLTTILLPLAPCSLDLSPQMSHQFQVMCPLLQMPGCFPVILSLDTTKSAAPDHLEPYFLKLAADFIAQPLQYIFNLIIPTNRIPSIWKIAYVLLLLKGGDPTCLNNYRPISKLCIL